MVLYKTDSLYGDKVSVRGGVPTNMFKREDETSIYEIWNIINRGGGYCKKTTNYWVVKHVGEY